MAGNSIACPLPFHTIPSRYHFLSRSNKHRLFNRSSFPTFIYIIVLLSSFPYSSPVDLSHCYLTLPSLFVSSCFSTSSQIAARIRFQIRFELRQFALRWSDLNTVLTINFKAFGITRTINKWNSRRRFFFPWSRLFSQGHYPIKLTLPHHPRRANIFAYVFHVFLPHFPKAYGYPAIFLHENYSTVWQNSDKKKTKEIFLFMFCIVIFLPSITNIFECFYEYFPRAVRRLKEEKKETIYQTKFTYPRVSSTTAVHDQAVRFVGADFEGYTAGLGRLPRWQDLKHRRHTSLNTFHSWLPLLKDVKQKEKKGKER